MRKINLISLVFSYVLFISILFPLCFLVSIEPETKFDFKILWQNSYVGILPFILSVIIIILLLAKYNKSDNLRSQTKYKDAFLLKFPRHFLLVFGWILFFLDFLILWIVVIDYFHIFQSFNLNMAIDYDFLKVLCLSMTIFFLLMVFFASKKEKE